MRDLLRGAALLARLRGETAETYTDARLEARTVALELGLDISNQHWDAAAIGDFMRLAYDAGARANEARLAAPDMADAIARAIGDPGSILERRAGESIPRWSTRAVQQAVAYGVPR